MERFSALLVIFRQARGDALTSYEGYFVLSFIQPGLIVTGGALLPSVFSLSAARCRTRG